MSPGKNQSYKGINKIMPQSCTYLSI